MADISPLRRRMIDDMMIRNLSPATQQSYLYAVAKFSRHFGRSPDRLGLEEVRTYQLHLIARQRSWSHVNQVVCALRFFYGVTLGQTEALERIVAAREPQKLPVVLSAEEIVRFLEAVPGLRNRAALTTAYGAGLRVGEVARLTTGAEQVVFGEVRNEKGDDQEPMADPDERVPDTDQGSGSVHSTPPETSAERTQQADSLAASAYSGREPLLRLWPRRRRDAWR